MRMFLMMGFFVRQWKKSKGIIFTHMRSDDEGLSHNHSALMVVAMVTAQGGKHNEIKTMEQILSVRLFFWV